MQKQQVEDKRLTVRIPQKVMAAIKIAAASKHMTIGALVKNILTRELKKMEVEGTIPRIKL